MLIRWYGTIDCFTCEQTFGSRSLCPCSSCQPEIHEFNRAVLILYKACNDQHIMGPSGPVGLNDVAVMMAMDTYFEVKKKEKLELSLAVRSLSAKIMAVKMEKD